MWVVGDCCGDVWAEGGCMRLCGLKYAAVLGGGGCMGLCGL